MNVIDKAIAFISPQTALKREAARQKLSIINSGYSHHGASRYKKSMLGWNSSGGSADEDIIENLELLRLRSRDLFMGTPLATGAIRTARTNIVGSGLQLKPQIDAEFLELSDEEVSKLEKQIVREFKLWSETVNCDACRQNNFYELQQLAQLSWLMSGDCFVLLPIIERIGEIYDLRVQIIEADKVCDPVPKDPKRNIKGGVELGEYGEIAAYWIAKNHPLSKNSSRNEWRRVESFGKKTGRRNVLHLMESERPEQRRGVPIFAPIIESLKQLGRYTEAELMAAVVSGMFTVFIKTENNQETSLGEAIAEEDQINYDENSYELGNGTVLELGPNESTEPVNPGRPNVAFDGFVVAICRQIGAALEIPYELLVKHFTASYSASRAALLEAWKMFKMRRSWLANDFCQPVYEEWLIEAVLKGRIIAPGFLEDPLIRKAYSNAEWYGPTQGQIDPLKEVNAAKVRISEGLSTRAKETAELTGGDFEENHKQRVKEERLRMEMPAAVNEKGGGKVEGN